MHDNDGQVTPVSQAFSVWTLAGNVLAAILRLTHELQEETIKAITLYGKAPGALRHGYTPEQASPTPETEGGEA